MRRKEISPGDKGRPELQSQAEMSRESAINEANRDLAKISRGENESEHLQFKITSKEERGRSGRREVVGERR
jgi:hypothetical protein